MHCTCYCVTFNVNIGCVVQQLQDIFYITVKTVALIDIIDIISLFSWAMPCLSLINYCEIAHKSSRNQSVSSGPVILKTCDRALMTTHNVSVHSYHHLQSASSQCLCYFWHLIIFWTSPSPLVFFFFRRATTSPHRESSEWTRPVHQLCSTASCTRCPIIDLVKCRWGGEKF